MNKIYLIDDDEDDHFIFKEVLQSINPLFKCDTALNGKIALDTLRVSTTLPDIIFLDLNMPVMNGFDFLINFKKDDTFSKIPIGIFTTSNTLKDQKLSKDYGARFFLHKPSSFEILSKKLRQLLFADFSNDNYIAIK